MSDVNTLKDLGLLSELNGRWKYKFSHDGSFFTANSMDDAIERAATALANAPAGTLLTAQQRFEAANAAEFAEMHRRYGEMSISQLQATFNRLEKTGSELRAAGAREFSGNGGRRTAAAVANEGARDAAQERQKLGRYIEERGTDAVVILKAVRAA